jgi:predicted hotdog family 3-hydroxylacyl-ACP dehydratase
MSATPLGREQIAWLIPHGGRMCLIDEVLSWDAYRIHCRTRSHLAPDNPLRHQGRLAALHLIEYGAQSMAIHGGLDARSRGESASPGLLVSARDVLLHVQHLDDLPGALELHAEQQLANAHGWLYAFRALCGERLLGSGRLAVMMRSGHSPN